MSEEKPAYIAKREERKATPAMQRLEEKKAKLLDGGGVYDLGWFSTPGEFAKCEHVMPYRGILGGLPIYRCDDCDYYFYIGAGGVDVIPKQHIPAYGLFLMAHFLKYEGPEALAQALTRPHVRIDMDRQSLPPIEAMAELKDEWDEAMRLIPEYTEKAMALMFPNGQKELTDGGDSDEVPGVQT